FSGNLLIAGKRLPLRGVFDTNGAAQVILARPGGLTITLQVDTAPDSDRLNGTITDGHWNAVLVGERTWSQGDPVGAFQPAMYPLIIARAVDGHSPGGAGYGPFTISSAGQVRVAGTLGDSTKFTQSATISRAGHWPFYTPLYGGKGLLLAWLQFT